MPEKEAKKRITLGFSPCPNDTFMFDAMVNGRLPHEGIEFVPVIDDVESLNRMARDGRLDVTKISFATYPKVAHEYQLLTAGSALGKGVGPLLVSKENFSDPEEQIKTVAIPGRNTTAYYLFKMFYPGRYGIKEMIFSEIEDSVLSGQADAGVIIHENRFTYEDKGLRKITDLGLRWEDQTGQAIPLGGIAIRRSMEGSLKKKINAIMRKSVQFAFANPDASREYVSRHAQEMNADVRNKHIGLYVNEFSVDLGTTGKSAIMRFLQTGEPLSDIFIE